MSDEKIPARSIIVHDLVDPVLITTLLTPGTEYNKMFIRLVTAVRTLNAPKVKTLSQQLINVGFTEQAIAAAIGKVS